MFRHLRANIHEELGILLNTFLADLISEEQAMSIVIDDQLLSSIFHTYKLLSYVLRFTICIHCKTH